MIHIKKILSLPFPIIHPAIEASVKKNGLIFDIETTGLNPHKNQVILIGFARFDKKGRFVLNQLFLDNPSEEAEMLSIFHRIAASSGFFVTYNGNSFDLPFINTRMKKHSQKQKLDSFYNVDLMRVLQTKYFNLPIPDYKLKTVEKYMGISRTDRISGKESVELYERYLSTKDPFIQSKILLHNSDDIINLFKLLKVFELTDNPEIFFDLSNEVNIANITFRFQRFKISGDFILLSGICLEAQALDYAYNDALFSFELNSKDGLFNLRIPVLHKNINSTAYSLIDSNSIAFTSELINSFIFDNPHHMVISTNGIIDKNNILNLSSIILKKILAP
ncbi:MAG: ribonuclease H-like domain-containing protein [Peptostreptococcaceae bacterium]|nr:ribonuclease H-like domain-containing protein [Peptostreptococcaceae bacterium]